MKHFREKAVILSPEQARESRTLDAAPKTLHHIQPKTKYSMIEWWQNGKKKKKNLLQESHFTSDAIIPVHWRK